MSEVKAKNTITFKVEGTCPSHSRTDVLARDTELTIDEPAERGGTNPLSNPILPSGPGPYTNFPRDPSGCGTLTSNSAKPHRFLPDSSASLLMLLPGQTL